MDKLGNVDKLLVIYYTTYSMVDRFSEQSERVKRARQDFQTAQDFAYLAGAEISPWDHFKLLEEAGKLVQLTQDEPFDPLNPGTMVIELDVTLNSPRKPNFQMNKPLTFEMPESNEYTLAITTDPDRVSDVMRIELDPPDEKYLGLLRMLRN